MSYESGSASPDGHLSLYLRASQVLNFRGVQVSEDKALVKTFTIVIAALVAIAVVFYFVANMVTGDDEGGQSESEQARVEENIKPVGQVNVGSAPASSAAPAAAVAAGPRSGEQVYNSACVACHSVGVAGAPKVGDSAAWAPRAAKGIDALVVTATSGINAMPPKGTCADCSEEELKGSIEYMLQQSGQ